MVRLGPEVALPEKFARREWCAAGLLGFRQDDRYVAVMSGNEEPLEATDQLLQFDTHWRWR
ncbi:MAG: hypothetical protein OXU72_12700 [Gammaproteobacteria bacterium]|nr:hypothetical protein [Gammaproteobacteria bacterium]